MASSKTSSSRKYTLLILLLCIVASKATSFENVKNLNMNISDNESKDKAQVIQIVNSVLNYFFNEFETNLGQVLEKSPLKNNDIIQPALFARQTTSLIKREVAFVMGDKIEQIDSELFQKIFGLVTAGMIAVSAYAYMV